MVCVVGVVCVVVCGVAHREKVCRFKTPPCVRSKRLRVYQHHAHMCYHMRAWCRYTRGRFERTHGGVSNLHTGEGGREEEEERRGGSSSVLLVKMARVEFSRASEVHRKKPLDLNHFQFENRSRTTCPRVLQSFAVPDQAVELQLS